MLAVEVAQHLSAQVPAVTFHLTTPGGNCFIGDLPDQPDEAVAIFSTGGPEASTKDGYAQPAIQVMVRGTGDPRTGDTLAQAIYDELHGLRYVTLPGGTHVVYCAGIQPEPVSLGEDENGRHRYSLNFRFELRKPTSHSLE